MPATIRYYVILSIQFSKECSESEDSVIDELQCYVCNQSLVPSAQSTNRFAETIMRLSCGHKSVSTVLSVLYPRIFLLSEI